MSVHVKNTSNEDRDIKGKIHVYASYNVGMSREELVKPLIKKLKLGPGEGESTLCIFQVSI